MTGFIKRRLINVLKSTLVVLILCGIPLCQWGCETCDEPDKFEILSVDSDNYSANGVMRSNESVKWDEFSIYFEFEVEYYSSQEVDFGSSLMATTCDGPGSKGDVIGLKSIELTALRDYNEDHLENQLVNDIIELANRCSYGFVDDQFYSMDSFLDINATSTRCTAFEVRLTQPPAEDGTYGFRLKLERNNGVVFEHTVQAIRIRT